ncbi:MAG: FAD-binding oxidoreductase [Gemmataceae bacterium]|nr:FAD-binding oxidoreductase [Gemmataceae bacterium]
MPTTTHIDGFGPLSMTTPTTTAELAQVIRVAAAGSTALYPVGGGTKLSLGTPPTRPGQAVSMGGLTRIIDFPARDMTVTVEAGIIIRELRDTLAREKLRLPIDVAHADRATLGGIIAANTSGPRRYGFGTLRDYVIGISALNDEGNEFKAGGRVVKNVAGYDICKLLTGSLGTLGIITQVTLKLRPLAEEQAIISLACDADKVESILANLHGSRTRPICLDLLNRLAARRVFDQAHLPVPDAAWVLLVGYEGNADAVSWQVQQLVKEVGILAKLEARVDFTAQPLWDSLVEFAHRPGDELVLKASVLPSAVATFGLNADRDGVALRAHAANGIVYGHWTADASLDRAAETLKRWRESSGTIVTRCPSEWKKTLDVWGPPRNDAWLMREVKAKFDPKSIFNPGRFVAGI